jgi:hypothetical protein
MYNKIRQFFRESHAIFPPKNEIKGGVSMIVFLGQILAKMKMNVGKTDQF